MSTKITDMLMTSTVTRHTARWDAGDANDPRPWIVTWLPLRRLTRDEATTAMVLAEHVARFGSAAAADPHVQNWAAELDLSAEDAVKRASVE